MDIDIKFQSHMMRTGLGVSPAKFNPDTKNHGIYEAGDTFSRPIIFGIYR